MKDLSRRQFLKGSALAVITGTIAPLVPVQSAATSKWVISSGMKRALEKNTIADVLSGGVLKIYSGAVPKDANCGNGKLIMTIGEQI